MVKLLIGLLLVGFLLGCQKDPKETEQTGPQPRIVSFVSTADTIGALVRILTMNSSPAATENILYFDTTPTTPFAVRGDTLLVRVPPGATSGLVALQVRGQRTTSVTPFTVLSGRWRRRADTPSARLWPVVVSSGTVAYWGLGELMPPGFRFTQRDLWRYDPAANGWERQADLLGPLRSNAVAFSLGSLIYVGMGRNANNTALLVHDFYAFSPTTNQWTPKASLPSPREDGFSVTFTLNGKAYLVGTKADRRTWEYDPQADTWTQKKDFPGSPRYDAVGFTLGNSAYVAGGTGDVQERVQLLDNFWAYTPSTDTWSLKATLPQSRRALMAFVVGSKAYAGINFTKDIYEYDPARDAWTLKTRFPGAAFYYTQGFSLNGKGYVVGGIPSIGISSELWEFTP
ncbi:Kelch repeat-containing protein [Hymenobacter radiodurans]|uniref:Kelch repeat-containing protein n=1 Tax=Hymenobacter radiodurans TaxID=2496028 RepID=UPI00105842B5|nr:kelch repeat-containing protein [Hymenobacter radiodurans]